jgi:hypothetical protein
MLDQAISKLSVLIWLIQIVDKLEVRVDCKESIKGHKAYCLTNFVGIDLLKKVVALLKEAS